MTVNEVSERYPHLLQPLAIRDVVFRNRLFVAPHNHATQAAETYPAVGGIMHYANIARGGAALVNCGSTQVDPLLRDPRIPPMVAFNTYDLNDVNGLHYYAQQVDAIHHFGAKASIELTELPFGGWMIPDHTGDVIDGSFKIRKLWRPVYGPMDMELPGGVEIKQMPEEEMGRIAEAFAVCAANAVKVGFDAILVHAGHGMLLSQFLDPLTNQRSDMYGGSHENRARFLKMVLERIRQKAGEDLIIELRISGDSLEPNGNHIEDVIEYLKFVEPLIDIAHISCGDGNFLKMTHIHPSDFLPPAPNIKYARKAKKSGVLSVPIATVGALQEPDVMEDILASGGADIISSARSYLSDPDFAKHVYDGAPDDVRPCIKCFSCLTGFTKNGLWTCSVNPRLGREHQLPLWDAPAAESRKVAVIGGGPAGMQTAITASDRGHRVILFEKTGELGGQIRTFENESFKYSTKKYKEYLIGQIQKRPIEVRLNTTATPAVVSEEKPDVVIPALGADRKIPPIKGLDNANVRFADEALENIDGLGEEVAIVGGGLTACEIACELGLHGKKVSVIGRRPRLAMDANNTYGIDIYRIMNETGVRQITGADCREITPDGVKYIDCEGRETKLKADTVIIAAGYCAKTKEALQYYSSARICRPVGDCVKARNIQAAVKEGFDAAICI